MAKYTGVGQKDSDNVASVFVVNNTSAIRFKLSEAFFSNSATPADATFVHHIIRTSDDPTGDAVTINPEDPADAAAAPAGFDGVSVDPTLTGADLIHFALHQRATFRWVAQPGRPFTAPATDNNGFANVLSAATTTADFWSTLMIET
jgi:hypothetical protein